ncbi:lipopolysaccharide biosynthesis protein [Corynebacterium anserum]|uniref:lipopolysaccharide biosynthesis protein n=1 Tax=Corynebacterium anserum TaxID=2684406 RepID=UPI00163A1F8F|nr:hypothetical protein [Corynebacterium anserum]
MRAISAATVFVAIAGYAIIFIAARALTPADYETFMVFWGLFFALTGVLDGLMQESARAVTNARSSHVSASPLPHTNRANPMRVTAGFAVLSFLLTLVSSPLWADTVSPGHEMWGVGLLAVGLLAYSFQASICGLLSAVMGWSTFAWLIALDSGVRLLLAAVAWWMGWQLLAYLIMTVLGAATWLLFVVFSGLTRSLLSELADVNPRAFAVRSLKAMGASGANAIIISGFPVLLKFTTDTAVLPGALAATITAVTLTRAPLLVPLQRFQPALIVHFTKNRTRVLRASLLPMAAVVTTAFAGGGAAWVLGQPIMRIFFKEDYIVSAQSLALLTVASGSTALLMISGSAALAADRHTLYLTGWVAATAAAIALLTIDASPETRSVLGLGLGPLVGVVVQLVVLGLGARGVDKNSRVHGTGKTAPFRRR